MSATKTGGNADNILKLLFFIINLHFVTSNQLSTDRKLNLPLTSSVYFVFFPLEIQKRLKQIKVYQVYRCSGIVLNVMLLIFLKPVYCKKFVFYALSPQ